MINGVGSASSQSGNRKHGRAIQGKFCRKAPPKPLGKIGPTIVIPLSSGVNGDVLAMVQDGSGYSVVFVLKSWL